jgi:hypothetical protein
MRGRATALRPSPIRTITVGSGLAPESAARSGAARGLGATQHSWRHTAGREFHPAPKVNQFAKEIRLRYTNDSPRTACLPRVARGETGHVDFNAESGTNFHRREHSEAQRARAEMSCQFWIGEGGNRRGRLKAEGDPGWHKASRWRTRQKRCGSACVDDTIDSECAALPLSPRSRLGRRARYLHVLVCGVAARVAVQSGQAHEARSFS